jgi:hypothetical protein
MSQTCHVDAIQALISEPIRIVDRPIELLGLSPSSAATDRTPRANSVRAGPCHSRRKICIPPSKW